MSTVATAAETLYVPIGMMRSIKAHAVENLQFECCGVIGGENGRALMLARCGNRADRPREAFFIDMHHQFKAEQAFEKKGLKMIGLYHSHPSRPAEPSQADLSLVPSDFVSLIYSTPDDEVKGWRGSTQVSLEVVR